MLVIRGVAMNDEKLSMIADAAVELVHEAITPILEKLDRLKTDMIIKQAHNATRIAMLEERSGALTAELTAERQLTADQQAYIRKCQERIGMVERERDEMRDQILAWLDADGTPDFTTVEEAFVAYARRLKNGSK